jgi:hypothetical protein
MDKPERIEFVFSFEYDPKKKDEFESVWNLGSKMLKMVDDYAEEYNGSVEIKVNESPGAVVDRQLASI